MEARLEFRATSSNSWSWVGEKSSVGKPAAAAGHDGSSRKSLTFETWSDEDKLVLGHIQLEGKTLVLSTNSEQRCSRGCALLSDGLGGRLRQPSVKTESIDRAMVSRESAMPNQLDIPVEEQRAIVHDYLDRHYRDVLDQPVPALDGQTPRAAVKTEGGRLKVVEWLKLMENRTAKTADPDDPMASYNFAWLWTELGLSERRE